MKALRYSTWLGIVSNRSGERLDDEAIFKERTNRSVTVKRLNSQFLKATVFHIIAYYSIEMSYLIFSNLSCRPAP